ncbi:carbonic anhydrase [Dyella flava]|uniref:carbonic anhydrase n=1 Tax=Dyella flava TaxID=1920170 RepID=UPI00235BAEDD|nr:carbonic anhydrase [Dyella flava]GLQ49879.1 hypothetical protein GCM10010872_13280 [Dyella flava]
MVPELVTQSEPGNLFVIRNAGNIVPSFGPEPGGVYATIEYVLAALGVTDIVICGHSDCGAMTPIAACKCLDHMPAVKSWLRYADSAKLVNETHEHVSECARPDALIRENVVARLNNLKTHPSVARALAQVSWICTDGCMTLGQAASMPSIARGRSSWRCQSIPA